MRRASSGMISFALLATLLLALGVSQATAIDIGHVFSSSIKGSGTNELSSPTAVDVDNSAGPSAGDIYVADASNHRVEKFDSAGNFILMFGADVNGTTNGDVCTLASGNTCQTGQGGGAANQLGRPTFLTVDGSPGPSAGDIYVADTVNNTIHKYNENGVLLGGWASGGQLNASFGQVGGIDVDSSGNLVVWDSGQGRFSEFTQSSSSLSALTGVCRGNTATGAGVAPSGTAYYKVNGDGSVERVPVSGECAAISQDTNTTGLTVDQASGTLYQVRGGEVDEYKFTGAGVPLESTNVECTNALVEFGSGCPATHKFGLNELSGAGGIGVNATTKTAYVADTGNHRVAVYIAAQAPIVITNGPTADKTVSGEVKLDGAGNITECFFEWGTEAPSYGHTAPCEPGALPYTSDRTVEATIPVLAAEQTYHYRLVAKGASGGTNFGVDKTITPHNVKGLSTGSPTNVTRNTADLQATYEGTNEPTRWYFKWGPQSDPYKNTTAAPPGETEIPTTGKTSLSAEITGLSPETAYLYLIVAENSHGLSEGPPIAFTTPPAVTGLTTEAASNLLPESAELNASFTGEGIETNYFFEYGSSTQYGNSTAEETLLAPSGNTSVPPLTVNGLQPLHTYHYRVVAKNSYGTTPGADLTFTTKSAPLVVTQSSSEVTATEATLHTVINPEGAETSYHFEYGPTLTYGTSAPIPDATIVAGETAEPRDIHLTGLNGGVYHFRIEATSKFGTTYSNDQTFEFYPPTCPNSTVRQQTGSNTLPDCRAYELVTPEDAGITLIFPSAVPFSAQSGSPSRLVYAGAYGLIEGVGEAANNVGDTYVATRTDRGWKTKYVGIPSSKSSMAGGPPWQGSSYEPDKWLINTLSNPSLSELVDWNDGYRGSDEVFEAPNHPGSSNAPYVWDSTTGNQVDRWPTNVGTVPGGEFFRGKTAASADLSHFIFTSNIPFAVGGEAGDMYDNDTVNDTIQIVSVKQNGEHIAETSPVAVSENGSHILMNTPKGELIMRVDDANTFEFAPGHSLNYIGMTHDGKTVYFTSTEDLTEDHSDDDSSRDLYMWSESSSAPNHLTEISKANEPGTGDTDACAASWTSQCDIVPISFGTYTSAQGGSGGSPYSDSFIAEGNGDIYFLSPEELAGNNGVNGDENLYVYRNEKLQFVAALDPSGVACTEDQGGQICSENAVARMEITPGDEHMAFLTGSKVTGYENNGYAEMYVYTPASNEVVCVSCRPSGEPPSASVATSHNGKFITDDGRTFFETTDALVPQDTNEANDVYEYVDGRPQLITSGTAASNNTFGIGTIGARPGLVGVSADGTDVYFATYDVLVGQDRNGEALKIYDARSGGGFQFNPPVPPCVAADECHGPSTTAPGSPPTGTGSELGATGNVKQQSHGGMKKGHGKKRGGNKRHKGAHRKGHRHG